MAEPPLEPAHTVPPILDVLPLASEGKLSVATVSSAATAADTVTVAAPIAKGTPTADSQLMGVSLSLMALLAAKAHDALRMRSGADNGHIITTKDVCDFVVIPETAESLCCYLDLYREKLDSEGLPYVGVGTVFLSHAWSYAFDTPLAVAREYQESMDVRQYFWFDLCANAQHPNVINDHTTRDHTWWSGTFKRSIETLGTVVLVLQPWFEPVPLTRSWCLWEILCAAEAKSVQLLVRLPAVEETGFHAKLLEPGGFNNALRALVRRTRQH